jgi:hypothetical protein
VRFTPTTRHDEAREIERDRGGAIVVELLEIIRASKGPTKALRVCFCMRGSIKKVQGR